ncbi:hypothetical protein HY988_02515 [Candidatus Micrarchaeota archaeon]|nr:hypothetical protein [Candidatus Micrarchaeota archaeon]
MLNRKIFVILILVLGFATVSFAATCASKAYASSCLKCTFDKDGKMDSQCFEGYQSKGIACLFSAYPIESIQYKAGACPAIEACINKLETCKAAYASSNDKYDCEVGNINHCFRRADTCVADAVKHCDTPSPDKVEDIAPPSSFCDGFFFAILPIFVGAMVVRRK